MADKDTQLPRFQVFLQEKIDAAHEDVGSVHASDPEMALQNARDVFVRRPECISIWVVREDNIYARTAQEIAAGALDADEAAFEETATPEKYSVFSKKRSAGTQTFVGEVTASNPVEALKRAVEDYSEGIPPFAWLVFPKRVVVSSTTSDIESMFAPARTKSFRMSTDFHTLTEMRKIISQQKDK